MLRQKVTCVFFFSLIEQQISHVMKKEDISFVESEDYVTFDQCNVSLFRFVQFFSQVENPPESDLNFKE